MGDCTLDKKSYGEVIAEDIKLVKQYIPDTFMLKTHILAVLHWSIDKQYPPEIWDKKVCPDCKGEGYLFFADQGEPDPDSKCDTCNGKGSILPSKETENKCSNNLPKGFMFNSAGRVVLDPKIIHNIDD